VRSQNAPKSKFSGDLPRTPLPRATSWWGGGSLTPPKNPIPALGPPGLVSTGLTVYPITELATLLTISNVGLYESSYFFPFQRTEKMYSVMKGLMGQCPLRIFGLEPPLLVNLSISKLTITFHKLVQQRIWGVEGSSLYWEVISSERVSERILKISQYSMAYFYGSLCRLKRCGIS